MPALSQLMSLIEAITNVVIGYFLAFLTQITISPILGITASITDNLLISSVFTVVSLVRSFTLRRLFEAARGRQSGLKS